MIRTFENNPSLTVDVDLTKECPYTSAAFISDGVTYLCLDRLAKNGALGDEPFAFPTKDQLTRRFPVKDVTAVTDSGVSSDMNMVIGRAAVVRSVVNKARPSGPINIPGLSGVDWDRVKENDRKFAKALRDLIPPSVQADPTRGSLSHPSRAVSRFSRTKLPLLERMARSSPASP